MTTQITLTETESQELRLLAEQTGKSEDEIIREALHQFLHHSSQAHRLILMRQARGMWKDRTDLPDFGAVRNEMDRL